MQVYGADKVNRQFKADRPNQLWVSDFTYGVPGVRAEQDAQTDHELTICVDQDC